MKDEDNMTAINDLSNTLSSSTSTCCFYPSIEHRSLFILFPYARVYIPSHFPFTITAKYDHLRNCIRAGVVMAVIQARNEVIHRMRRWDHKNNQSARTYAGRALALFCAHFLSLLLSLPRFIFLAYLHSLLFSSLPVILYMGIWLLLMFLFVVGHAATAAVFPLFR